MAATSALLWDTAVRWRQYEAEVRVNVVRIAAVGTFYCVHLAHHWAANGGPRFLSFLGLDDSTSVSDRTHIAVTCLAVAWLMIAALVHRLLLERIFPRWLMFASTCGDVALLTAMLVLSSGAASPLVLGYLLIIMMAGLRLDLRLVYCAAGVSILGYLVVLGITRWPLGLAKGIELPRVPRFQQLMTIAALVLAGVIAGQWVRLARRLAHELSRAQTAEGPA